MVLQRRLPILLPAIAMAAVLACGGGSDTGGASAVEPTASAANTTVTWSIVEGSTGGSITTTGAYTAPQATGTYHVVVTSVGDPTKTATATITVTSTPPSASRYVGVNVGWAAPNVPDQIFADMLKSGRPWTNSSDSLVGLDSKGWPAGPARIGFMEGNVPSYLASSGYKLRFNGPSCNVVSAGGGGVTISNAVYSNGVCTADVTINSITASWFDFSAAVQNVALMRPGHTYGVDYFNKDFLAAIAPFSLLRTMQTFGPGLSMWGAQMNGVMANRDTTWASRQKPGAGYAYNGPSIEDLVLFANLTGKDVWVNIPLNATLDYITKFAQVFRYGSDGSTFLPYTSTTHDPATWNPSITSWYPGLLPGRNVYVEFSNEIWNYLGSGTSQYNAEMGAGDPHHLNFNGLGGGDIWVAWKVVQIGYAWRQVWGDSAMGSRVRIVMANQGDWGQWWRHGIMLSYIQGVFGGSTYGSTIDGVPTGHPVNWYINNISGSLYSHDNNPGNLDTYFSQLTTSLSSTGGLSSAGESNSIVQRIDWADSLAAQYGLKFSSYEAGTEVPNGSVEQSGDSDARIQTHLLNHTHYFYNKANEDVWVYFWLVGPAGSLDCGLGPTLRSTNTLRWQTIRQLAAGN